MGGFEELFEVLGSDVKRAQGSLFGRLVSWIGEFDGANRTKGAFVTEDEINGFILDETFGSLAILRTNFVVEKRGNFNLRNDVKFFAKKFDQELEAELFRALHETFTRAIASASFEALAALADADTGKNRHKKQGHDSYGCGSQVDLIRAEEFFNVHVNYSRICHLL